MSSQPFIELRNLVNILGKCFLKCTFKLSYQCQHKVQNGPKVYHLCHKMANF